MGSAWMRPGRIPNDLLYGELAQGKCPQPQTSTAIQRCLPKGLKGRGYRPQHVGSCSLRPNGLKEDCAERPVQLWTVTHAADWGKEKEEKGPWPGRPAGNGSHLRPVRQPEIATPILRRTFQSYQIPTLHQYHHPERNDGCLTITLAEACWAAIWDMVNMGS